MKNALRSLITLIFVSFGMLSFASVYAAAQNDTKQQAKCRKRRRTTMPLPTSTRGKPRNFREKSNSTARCWRNTTYKKLQVCQSGLSQRRGSPQQGVPQSVPYASIHYAPKCAFLIPVPSASVRAWLKVSD